MVGKRAHELYAMIHARRSSCEEEEIRCRAMLLNACRTLHTSLRTLLGGGGGSAMIFVWFFRGKCGASFFFDVDAAKKPLMCRTVPAVRTFWIVDPQLATIVFQFNSRTARDAALKAVTRGRETNICVVDASQSKLHTFDGFKKELAPERITAHARARGIAHRPCVQKTGYRAMDRGSKLQLPEVCEAFRAMTGSG